MTLPDRAPANVFRGHCRQLIWLVLACSAWSTTGLASMAADAERFQKDLGFLSTKIAQYRYPLKATPEGAGRLAILEQSLAKMKSSADQLAGLAGDLDTQDSHLHYLKDMELEPKEREVSRIRQNVEEKLAQLDKDWESLRATIKRHNDQPHTFSKEEAAALAAYDAEKAALEARSERLWAEDKRVKEEMQGLFQNAALAYAKAQKEFGAAETRREETAQQLQEQIDQYTAARGPLVEQLVQMDNEPSPARLPLTPFPKGVPPDEAGLVPRSLPPVGPAADAHAIDELRVVTASSRAAVGRDEHDRPVTPPRDPETVKTLSSYQFDTSGGLGPAPLPDVDAPAAQPVDLAVPLVVPPAPIAREDAPPAIRQNPKLQELDRKQSEDFKRLEGLYAERKKLAQAGAAADPADWTRVVKEISSTHAEITQEVVAQKLIAGSRFIDLTVVPAPQRTKVSDIVVPPPDTAPAVPKP